MKVEKHSHYGGNYGGAMDLKEFLGNIVKPFTGSIYNGVSRAYPEYRNQPQVCTRPA